MTTTLNPADKSAGITLSGSNLVATNNSNTISGVRALDKQAQGKFYWETTLGPFTHANDAISLANYSVSLTQVLSSAGAGTGVIGVMANNPSGSNGAVHYDGAYQFSLGGLTSGATICVAADLTGQKVWLKQIGARGWWNSVFTNDPAASIGGANCAAVTPVDVVPFVGFTTSGDSVTVNFGTTAFVSPAPSGFVGWPKTGGGFSTWSTTDKTNTTLTNGNLTATATGSGFIRAADKQLPAAGKFYWEVTVAKLSGNGGIGFCPSALAAPAYNNQTCFHINSSGSLYMNGGISVSNLVPIVAGCTLGIAVDLVANKVWFRNTLASLWNGSATADPAAGVGGIAVPTVGQPFVVAPLISLQNTNDAVTANFGASAFVGAVPAGFTSGWSSTGVPGATNVIATQISVEEWVRNIGTTAIVTQIAIEEWASVASVPPPVVGGGAQTRAMVMA
jgi:hypothetical protein